MAMAGKKLALCCGPTVTIWDCATDSNGGNAVSFQPHGNRAIVSDLSWNHNAQVLASCCSSRADTENDDDNVVLTSAASHGTLDSLRHDSNLKHPASFVAKHGAAVAAATSVAFGGKSRYLTVGDSSGAVCLWDLKKKTRVRNYFHSGAASIKAAMDPTDSLVLSLTQNALHVFRLREGTLANTLLASAGRYSTFSASVLEPHKVAIGARTGSVDVWNVASQTKVNSLSPHTGEVTGMAFSPTNKLLLASASVDQSLVFSDAASSRVLQRMDLGSCASCLSFHDDGVTCAVGTDSGRVLTYDLRQPKDSFTTYQANNRVSALGFASDASVVTNGRPGREVAFSDNEQKAVELNRFRESAVDGGSSSSMSEVRVS